MRNTDFPAWPAEACSRVYTDQPTVWRYVRDAGPVVLLNERRMFTAAEDVAAVFASRALRRVDYPTAESAGDADEPYELSDVGRDLLAQAMNPRAARGWAAQFRAPGAYLFDIIAGRGGCEAVSEVIAPATAVMAWILLGAKEPQLFREGGAFNLRAAITARRSALGGDLVSRLIRLAPQLTDEEVYHLAARCARPLPTIGQVFGVALFELGRDPVLARALRGNRDAIRVFVEEAVRLSPARETTRIALADTRIGDVDVPAGEHIEVSISAANREAAGGDNFNEGVRRHWGFGAGRHRCLANHAARSLLCVALETWLDRIPEFRVPAGFVPTFRPPQQGTWFEELPLTWSRPTRLLSPQLDSEQPV
ncbi:cytochrome P450 [Mycobacterium avium subsp. hominissuis]